MAEQEVAEMGDLQRQPVERIVLEDPAVAGHAAGIVAIEPGTRRRRVLAFAVISLGQKGLKPFHRALEL